MNIAGEAASLFDGPADSASDLFAPALDDGAPASEHPPTSNASDFFSSQESPAAAGLFASEGETDFFSVSGGTNANDYGTYNNGSADYGRSYDAYGGHASSAGTQYSQQTYDAGHAQYGSTEAYGHQQGASGYGAYDTSNTKYSYDAYAPYATNLQTSYATNLQTSYATTAPVKQASTYDPYAPAAPITHAAIPAPVSNTSQEYDPYQPSATPVQQPVHAVSAYTPARSPPVPTVPPLVSTVPGFAAADVPPPLPSASAYRPKTRNAYDPPLPLPKPKRSHSNWQTQSPAFGQIPYLAAPGSSTISPPPPPPPTRGATPGRAVPPPQTAQQPFVSPGINHQQYAPPPPARSQYDVGSSASSLNPPPRPDVYTPPPPPVHSTSAHVQPPATYAPPARPSLDHSSSYNNNYVSGHTGESGLGLYDRPVSPQKQPIQHEATSLGTDAASLFGNYSNTETADHAEPSYSTYAEAPEGAQSELGLPAPLVPQSLISPPPTTNGPSSKPTSPVPFDLTESPTQLPPKALSRHQSPERTRSPGASSVRSIGSVRSVRSASTKRRSVDQPLTRAAAGSFSPTMPPPSTSYEPLNRSSSPVTHPYVPSAVDHIRRATSPATFTSRSPLAKDVTSSKPPVPLNGSASSYTVRDRSMSSSSTLSLSSAPPKDPYAPSSHSRQPSVDSYKYSSPPQSFHVPSESAFAAPTTPGVQTLSVPTRLTQAPYAPSPSLLGSNDPLGRTSVRIPVVSFGFGGKLVTCFHGASNIGVGFDVAINSRDVHIRTLHKIIPQSALDNSSASYPGPLFLDPGTPVTSLVRTATTTQAKTKKTRVVKYLDERAEEISQGLGYLHRESLEGRRAEATLTLLLLLKVMVENDGKLSGSAQIDAAVRKALVPHVASQEPAAADSMGSPPLVPHGFTSIPSAPFGSVGSVHNDSPISVNTLRSAHLDKIQEYLIRGERRLAFQYAADEKLWAHAMVIASSIDRDAWKEVVREFIQAELTINSSAAGRESLRVAYSLYAGHGAASVEQLAPQKLLINNVAGLQAPPLHGSTVTPLSPNFPLTAPSVPIAQEVLSKWMETATMIITNPMTTEASSALTALGDQLLSNHWIEAAHVCYLLSPQTSPMGGANNVAARVVLVGGANPATSPSFWKNLDPVIFTEIAEFALSLGTTAKGQEAFGGLPHLQAYRLIRATYLAEIGHVQVAHRYCEAISSSLGRSSPYVHSTLLAELKSLTDRLIAAPQLDKSGSWIGSKMTRPSLDKLGNWLEGRLTSFIAGEGDTPTSDTPHKLDHSFSGPFAHYSQITSATPSNIPTPQRSMTDLTEVSNHAPTPPYRSGSAMALRPPASVPINRASSAMDYVRRKASPVPRVSSASAATASFADAYSPDTNGYSHFSESTPKPYQGPSNRRLETSTETDERSSVAPHTGSWWNDTTESTVPTPTVANFVKAEGVALESTDGFVSLMDDNAFSVTPTPSSMKGSYSNQSHVDEVDEEDDLGFGNSSRRSTQVERSNSSSSTQSTATVTKPTEPAKDSDKPAEVKPPASSGWLSRLWKRGETPGPVKANLGEQTSFYYDKDLKRWVNKNSSGEEEKPAALPPPPRAQTASPGTSTARLPTGPPLARTPPVRPATTTIDLTDSPPKQPPMRIRSNLVPPDAQSAPSTPAPPRTPLSMDAPLGDGPPPPGARARAAQAKRNVRNRYVDVFQQQ